MQINCITFSPPTVCPFLLLVIFEDAFAGWTLGLRITSILTVESNAPFVGWSSGDSVIDRTTTYLFVPSLLLHRKKIVYPLLVAVFCTFLKHRWKLISIRVGWRFSSFLQAACLTPQTCPLGCLRAHIAAVCWARPPSDGLFPDNEGHVHGLPNRDFRI